MSNAKAQMSNQIQSSNPHDWLVTTNDENIDLTTPTPPLPSPRGRERVGGSCICVLNVKIFEIWYLTFNWHLPACRGQGFFNLDLINVRLPSSRCCR